MATENEQYLLNRKAALEATNAGIAQQIEELEAQEAANDEEIDNIDAQLAFISAGYPAIPQLATPGTFTGVATAVAGVYTTELDWADVVNATGYVLERALLADFSDAVEIYSNSTSAFTDPATPGESLNYNLQYYYRVKATAAGYQASEWAEVIVDMFEQLATPQNLVLTPASTEVLVEFDEVPLAITYDVYRNTSATFGTATLIGDGISTNSINDTGRTASTQYWYWVIAKSPSKLNSDAATDDTTTLAP